MTLKNAMEQPTCSWVRNDYITQLIAKIDEARQERYMCEQALSDRDAEIERLTIERDEARKLASDWSNECGAEVERLTKVLQKCWTDPHGQASHRSRVIAINDLVSANENLLKERLREALEDCREGGGVRFNSDGSLEESV